MEMGTSGKEPGETHGAGKKLGFPWLSERGLKRGRMDIPGPFMKAL
jgi:hypothetical protein